MLIFNDVQKEFKNFTLYPINFRLEKYDFLSIIGNTGSGKTLILDFIAGIRRPDSGKILLNNEDLSKVPIHKRDISLVYQDSFLFPHLNVEENIKYGLQYKKVRGFDFDYIVKFFRIKHLLKRNVQNLSGGEKQRVALARAIIVKPSLLLLDEPFSAIDENLKINMVQMIKRVHKELKLTTIMVTHAFNDLWQLSNKTLLIQFGKVLQFGTVEDLFYKPINEEVARFVKMTNIIKLSPDDRKIFFPNKHFGNDETTTVGIRPEYIEVSTKKINGKISLKSRVISIINEGMIFSVYFEHKNFILHCIMSKNEFYKNRISLEKQFYLNIFPEHIHILR